MNDSQDHNSFIFDKIDNFVREPFDEVLSYPFIFYRVDGGIPCYEIKSSINLQEEVMTQPFPLVFIPGVGFLQVVFSLRPDNNSIFHCLLTILS